MPPILGNRERTLFLVEIWVLVAIAMFFTDQIYHAGPVATAAVAIAISSVSMQVVARWKEKRWLWPPSTQYRSFFWGDLICLPGAAALLSMMVEHLPGEDYAWQNWWWTITCVIVAIAAGIGFRTVDEPSYGPSEFDSPTKLLHDLGVYPAFTFFLLKQGPALFVSDWGLPAIWHGRGQMWIPLLALALVALWAYWGTVYDGKHKKPLAHQKYRWKTA